MKRSLSVIILVLLTCCAAAQGLVIGIVDSGFDYTHPAFRASDGTLLITRVWEQGTEGTSPSAYTYGLELSTPTDILNAKADNTTQSHGTHVAARALQYAGNDEGTELVLVSKGLDKLDETHMRDAIQYVVDYAQSVGKPCVINMSLGTHLGPHDGTSAFDRFINGVVGPGRIIVGSVGNSGQSTCHMSTTTEPLQTFVIFRSQDYTTGTVEVWGSRGMEYDVQLSAVQYATGNVNSQSEVVSAGKASPVDYTWAPTTGRLKGNFTIHSEVDDLNGKTHTTISIDQKSAAMNYALALAITPRSEGTLHAWADDIYSSFHSHDLAGYTMGDHEYSISELGGTADSIVSVGALAQDGSVAPFSSIGPRTDGATKPNVLAPGEQVESALNSYDIYQSTYPTTRTVECDGRTYHYGLMSGTSMAAPMVTGVVGSWLRQRPALCPTQAMALMHPDTCIDPAAGLPTGIHSTSADATAPNRWFDLSGRQVSHPRHGIYIVGGRKVVR